MSGMLSKTADRKPSPNAVCRGRRERRLRPASWSRRGPARAGHAPLNPRAGGAPVGLADRRALRSASQTATPMNGKLSACSVYLTLMKMLVAIADTRMKATIPTRAQSIRTPGEASLRIGEYLCCCSAAGMPKTTSASRPATYAVEDRRRRHAVDPHHGRPGVADDRSRPCRRRSRPRRAPRCSRCGLSC